MGYVLLGIAVFTEVIATSFLRQSEGFTRPVPTLISATAYVIAFYCFSLSLARIPTGVAYAIWSGIGTIAIAGIAWYFQGQNLDAAALAGIMFIVAGVIIISLFSAVTVR